MVMINRIKDTKHGYILAEATNEEFQGLLKRYPEKVRCIICNKKTSELFRVGFLGQNIISINNNVPDGAIYINHRF